MPVSENHVRLFIQQIMEAGYTEPRSKSYVTISQNLNHKGFETYRGKPWTAESVRQFVNYHRSIYLQVAAGIKVGN